ncbi:MAG: c-type cytochrome [Gammaproteobacteria bacterium]|nr:c-type cytochrome [Gammaproteobacteria bacterium]
MRALFRILSLLSIGVLAHAADGDAILRADCAQCHALSGSAAGTLEALRARKAPDLFYAGNKFRREWLGKWLQKPARLRPTGFIYLDYLKKGEKADIVDAASLTPHPALASAEANAVADALMKLRTHDDLIAKEKLEPGTISRAMGEMVFDKFSGCLACHLIEPEYGGVTGPELYTAGARLQAEYIASLIRAPHAWQPKTWMPNKHLSDANIVKIVRYLDTLAKENARAQP